MGRSWGQQRHQQHRDLTVVCASLSLPSRDNGAGAILIKLRASVGAIGARSDRTVNGRQSNDALDPAGQTPVADL